MNHGPISVVRFSYDKDIAMETHTGFKEWAAVCRALGSGRQIVILRKGGILEEGGEFKPDRSEFLLLPSYLHQSAIALKPSDQRYLEEARAERPDGDSFVTDLHAVVAAVQQVQTIEGLDRIRESHIWSDEIVRERFRRWGENSVWALLVRVWRLPAPVSIPALPQYQGCKSWVELQDPISITGAEPVLADDVFACRLAELIQSLQAANPDH